jgi:hypothetical protein
MLPRRALRVSMPAVAALGRAAVAQGYPNRPIRLVAPTRRAAAPTSPRA